MPTPECIIAQTRLWVRSVVVELELCPFARREVERDSVRYHVVPPLSYEQHLQDLIAECQKLDDESGIETSLLIYPDSYQDFDDYLDYLYLAEALLIAQGYKGIYQLASFHPHYCFGGEAEQAASNYTNRSPYPMLHILREASVGIGLGFIDDPEQIPVRNLATTERLGREHMADLLAQCLRPIDSMG